MTENVKKHTNHQLPAVYQIRLQGKLDDGWSAWFDDMTIRVEQDEDGLAVTSLTGLVADQPALHGLLSRVRDLGLVINTITRMKESTKDG